MDEADQIAEDQPDGFEGIDQAVEIHVGFDGRVMKQGGEGLGGFAKHLIKALEEQGAEARGKLVARDGQKMGDSGQAEVVQGGKGGFIEAEGFNGKIGEIFDF